MGRVATVIVCVLLCACGGGGGGSTPMADAGPRAIAACILYACSGGATSCSLGAECGMASPRPLYSVDCESATGCTCEVYQSSMTTKGTVLPFDGRYCDRGANLACSNNVEALFAELNVKCGWGLQ